MSDFSAEQEPGSDDSLVSRLRIVEEQPLADRAAAYGSLHEELARRLEGVGGLADPRLASPAPSDARTERS